VVRCGARRDLRVAEDQLGEKLLGSLMVLEAGESQSCVMAGGLLSDMGASVLMLEPQEGVALRTNPAFHVWARGKQSVTSTRREEQLRELAGAHDVLIVDDGIWHQAGKPRAARVTAVIGSSVPGTVEPVLPSVAPSIADCFSGFAGTQQGMRPGPFFMAEPVSPFGTAVLTSTGILASLCANGSDESETVHVSHLAGALGMMMFSAVSRQEPGETLADFLDGDPKRLTFPLLRFFRAADEWIVVGAVSGGGWVNLCLALDRVDLLSDPRYEGAPFNIPDAADRIALVDTVQEIIGKRPAAEWLQHFREAGVITGPVLLPPLGLQTDQVKSIGMCHEVVDPALGLLREPGVPIAVVGAKRDHPRPAPALGAHDAESLARLRNRALPEQKATERSNPPLSSLRVLDFASVAAAPGISRLLAGMGAEVIKIEPPGGDHIRAVAFTFISVNAGKRSVTTKLAADRPVPELEDLVKHTDVVIHNFRRSAAVKMGLTSERFAALNPNLIEIMVSGYGHEGPDADMPSIDPVFEALSGGALVQGGGHEPFGYTGGPNDNGTSLLGALATMAALYRRRHDPGNQHIGVSLLSTALYRHAEILVEPLSDWRQVTLGTDPLGPSPTHRLYRASDGWVLLAVITPEEWSRLRDLDPRLPEFFPRHRSSAWGESVTQVLEETIASRSVDELLDWCAVNAVPAVRAHALDECLLALRDAGSSLVRESDHPEFGRLISLHELIGFDAPGWQLLSNAPVLGDTPLAAAQWSPAGRGE
jgi:crotonobetainyl-CoA:carnitine CoA-transferase CaiB-like acyl-CoA transferase